MTPDAGNTRDQRPADRSAVLRRRTLAAIAVLVGGGIALSACGHLGGKDRPGGSSTAVHTPAASPSTPSPSPPPADQAQQDANAARNASDAKITITPKAGSAGAALSGAVKVSVTGGTLTSVTMNATVGGGKVGGTLSADHTRWTPGGSLARGTQYRISADAVDAHGRQAAANTTFATTSAPEHFVGHFTPEDGSTVGVGMPVSITFDKPVYTAHRADVQRAITVQSSSGQQAVGHWFGPNRLDLRPHDYWQPGSQVSLTLKLRGVKAEPGVYGVQNKTVHFTVGRSQISTVDARTHMMTVVRDGQVIRTIAISAGAKGHATYGGQMVIAEKDLKTRMNGATVGFTENDGKGEYDIPDVPHAMRLSDSGTFIHGNYWADPSVFGQANTSHGCIGLRDVKGGGNPYTPAAWFYDHSLVGDVIVVTNSPDRTIGPANGLNGWNLSWQQWLAGSAL